MAAVIIPINQEVSSYVLCYEYMNGNAQSSKGYIMPNDEKESDRLDIFNQLMLVTYDHRLHLAPIKQPQRVLDIGTGTGAWAIEMGMLLCPSIITVMIDELTDFSR